MAVDTMGSSLLRVSAANDPADVSCGLNNSTPTTISKAAPKVPGMQLVNVNNGFVTVWSTALNSTRQPKQPFHTTAQFVPDPAHGVWCISIANLSFKWPSPPVTLSLQRQAKGWYRPSDNTIHMRLPLKNVPVVSTITLDVFNSSKVSYKTNSGETIKGRPVDPKTGKTTLVASQTITLLLVEANVYAELDGSLSPWPLPPLKGNSSVKSKNKVS